jgi:putative ribosome biogenesis GTPase RsgA
MDREGDEEVPILVNMPDDDDSDAPQLIVMEVDEDQEVENDAVVVVKDLSAVPVTILAGFSGSGKTTLVQYILQSPDHGRRIAVMRTSLVAARTEHQFESMIARDGARIADRSHRTT